MKRLQWLLFSILVAASVGVLWTSAFASIEIRENAYLPLGLPNNAVSTFLNATREGALAGALVGTVLFVAAVVLRFVWRAALLDRAHGWLPYLLCTSAALIVIGAQTFTNDSIGALRTWGVIVMAALWCGLFVSRRWPFVARHTVLSTFVATNLYLVPALTFAMAFFFRAERAHLMRRPEMIVAAIATYPVCHFMIGRLSRINSDAMPRRSWLLTLPVFLPPIVLVVSPLFLEPGLTLNRPANVLLIGIDTLRVDHTSLPDGSKRDTSPHLAALAARGTFFETAISQAPWTMPAFGSVMTGRYPRLHGAVSFDGYLKPSEITLAELLREADFETAGIVSYKFVDAAHGFAQGFDAYDDTNAGGIYEMTSVEVTDLALEYLRKSPTEPFFLFLHYFDPHYEYRDHPEFDYADDYQGWLRDDRLEIVALRDRRHDLSNADLDYLRDLYDEEIASTDAQLGRVFSYLNESGLDKNTIVVVVADHGEEFMERGWLGHATSLHEELIHVPLIIALPRGEDQVSRVTTPVETRAILATLLDIMGPERATAVLAGSVLPLMTGKTYEASEPIAFSEVWLPDASIGERLRMSSLRTARWKFTKNLTFGEEHLYDLANDPDERTDLVERETLQAKKLRDLLDAWLRSMDELAGEAPTIELTEEQIRQLRSLGYIR